MREKALPRHAQSSPAPADSAPRTHSAEETPAPAPARAETKANSDAPVSNIPKEKRRTSGACTPPLTEEEETILALLKNGPLTQDELLYAAQKESPSWTSASVSAVLMILEVKRLARRLTDTRYEART